MEALVRLTVRRFTILTSTLVAAALAVTGCGSSGGDDSGGSGGNGGGGSVIKIGMVYEGGGGFAGASEAFVHGIKAAAQKVNDSGGVTVDGKKYTFQIDTCNDHNDQTQTTPCVNKLVLDHGDKFMFGGLADFGPIVRGITEKNHVIYFSTGTAVASLMSSSKYVVNTVPTDEVRAFTDVKAIQKFNPNAKRIAFVGDKTLTWSKDIEFISKALKDTDLKIVTTQTVPTTIDDYSSVLTQVKTKKPDVIVTYMSASGKTQTLLKQVGQLHVAPALFNASGVCDSISAGKNGVSLTSNLNIGAVLTGSNVTAAAKDYLKTYYANGYKPNPDPNEAVAAYAYDSIGWLAQSMEKAASTSDVDKILAAMNGNSYNGLNGNLTMKDNQETYGQVMCHSDNGAKPFSQTLIAPPGA
jgi:branched-chain amino acid transport system substrate-binding protein